MSVSLSLKINTYLLISFRSEYVDLYIDFVLNVSVLRQFQGFSDGFMKVCGGKVMELFEPHELMAVVVGNEDYDWHVLEEESVYNNGYTSGDPTVMDKVYYKLWCGTYIVKYPACRSGGFGKCSTNYRLPRRKSFYYF